MKYELANNKRTVSLGNWKRVKFSSYELATNQRRAYSRNRPSCNEVYIKLETQKDLAKSVKQLRIDKKELNEKYNELLKENEEQKRKICYLIQEKKELLAQINIPESPEHNRENRTSRKCIAKQADLYPNSVHTNGREEKKQNYSMYEVKDLQDKIKTRSVDYKVCSEFNPINRLTYREKSKQLFSQDYYKTVKTMIYKVNHLEY